MYAVRVHLYQVFNYLLGWIDPILIFKFYNFVVEVCTECRFLLYLFHLLCLSFVSNIRSVRHLIVTQQTYEEYYYTQIDLILKVCLINEYPSSYVNSSNIGLFEKQDNSVMVGLEPNKDLLIRGDVGFLYIKYSCILLNFSQIHGTYFIFIFTFKLNTALDINIQMKQDVFVSSNVTQEKLMMFLNEPIFFKFYNKEKDLTGNNLQFALKKIYANEKIIRRYQVLQQAKELSVEDKMVDTNIDFLITHLQAIQQNSAKEILETQIQKQELIEKFQEMQLKEKQLRGQFQNINVKLQESDHKFNTLIQLKKNVDKLVEKTQIIRALSLSNKALKQQNLRLQQKQQDSDKIIQKLMSQIKYLRNKQ